MMKNVTRCQTNNTKGKNPEKATTEFMIKIFQQKEGRKPHE